MTLTKDNTIPMQHFENLLKESASEHKEILDELAKLEKTYIRNLELVKEENALKENTYTISYKQKVNDEWVLVTKTGRSDSEEAKDIVRDLIAGDIPEEHLEVLICSLEVGEKLTELIEEGKSGINE